MRGKSASCPNLTLFVNRYYKAVHLLCQVGYTFDHLGGHLLVAKSHNCHIVGEKWPLGTLCAS